MDPENGAGARAREGVAGSVGAGARGRSAPASCPPDSASPRHSRAFCPWADYLHCVECNIPEGSVIRPGGFFKEMVYQGKQWEGVVSNDVNLQSTEFDPCR